MASFQKRHSPVVANATAAADQAHADAVVAHGWAAVLGLLGTLIVVGSALAALCCFLLPPPRAQRDRQAARTPPGAARQQSVPDRRTRCGRAWCSATAMGATQGVKDSLAIFRRVRQVRLIALLVLACVGVRHMCARSRREGG